MSQTIAHVFIWSAMLLNLSVALWLLCAVTTNWHRYNVYQRRFKFALIAYSFSIAFLTGEVIEKRLPVTGYRYAVLTVVSAYMLWVLVANRHHYDKS